MSEIRVTTVSDTAGTGPVTLTKQMPLRAWVNFNGTGTIAARDSLNLSSLTDHSAGNYEITYTNAWNAVTYSFTGTSGKDASGSRSTGGITFDDFSSTPSTTAHRIASRNKDSLSDVDCAFQMCQVVGDLA